MSGTLYICATPIGNMDDITLRALKILKEADLIAAEDTRRSGMLLKSYDIMTPLTSYHEHNRFEKAEVLIDKLLSGDDIALISDAGTPVISDPGEVLVKRALEEGIKVSPVPGACALISALSMSGISGRRFCFEGFLPGDKKERGEILAELKAEPRTIILYEAPHRLKGTLALLAETLGERRIAVCRELTKIHEETVLLTLPEAVRYYEENKPRGEFVLVIEGRDKEEAAASEAQKWERMSVSEHLELYMNSGMEKKEAMKRVAADRNTTKRVIYDKLLNEKEN